jgi:hypothetical protein
MTLNDILLEVYLGVVQLGDNLVSVNSHARDQAINRDILPTDVDRVLKKLPSIKSEIAGVAFNQEFWVYDKILSVGLGMRKGRVENGKTKLDLNTLVASHPNGNLNPTFYVA